MSPATMENDPVQTHTYMNHAPTRTTVNEPINLPSPPPLSPSDINGEESRSPSRSTDDDEYFNSMPPGYRFIPTDVELILEYLMKKINNEQLPRNRIHEVNLYKFDPEHLAERHTPSGDMEWYFFTPRKKKYKGGLRPNRAAGEGYWKATGADKSIKHNGEAIGFRKTLVYYRGKPHKGTKTDWVMQEFRPKSSPVTVETSPDSMKLDDCVLCKIYKKPSNSKRKPNGKQEANDDADGVDEEEMRSPILTESTQFFLPHGEAEVDQAEASYSHPFHAVPSVGLLSSGEGSSSDGNPGVPDHSNPFNHQPGTPAIPLNYQPGTPAIPLNYQPGMSTVYNFGDPIGMVPPMYPESQNDVLVREEYPMHHMPMAESTLLFDCDYRLTDYK